jgi:8-oxo-dGTP pyrophosphatase MutT (NUDIX family)
MRYKRAIQKVTALITRVVDGQAEILLMEHPRAGIQLPAGTVELAESLETAVLRECAEETGLEQVALTGELGQIELELPEDERIVTRVTKLFNAPASDASSVGGFGLARGSSVRVLRTENGFAEVVSDPLDLSQEPPVRVDGVQGFVRLSLLTGRVERHLFHLTAVQETPDSWQSFSDGVAFRIFWQPLTPQPSLHPTQQPWLDQVYPQLKQAVETGSGG